MPSRIAFIKKRLPLSSTALKYKSCSKSSTVFAINKYTTIGIENTTIVQFKFTFYPNALNFCPG